MPDENKSPYRGIIFSIIFMCIPSIVLTWLFNVVINLFQFNYGKELNWASAKVLGCGLGTIYHFTCWLTGSFKESFKVVKNRIKEFFSDLSISPSLAFECYWEDIKSNGIVFWIYFAIVVTNMWIAVSAFFDFISIRGWTF